MELLEMIVYGMYLLVWREDEKTRSVATIYPRSGA